MMDTKKTALFMVLWISTVTSGILDLSCDTTRPFLGTDVTCKCVTQNNIEWQLNDVSLSVCTTFGVCSPIPTGYEFTTDTNNNDTEYSLTAQQFDYNSCAVYSCTDLSTNDEQAARISIAAFNSTSPSVIEEPGDHKNGTIQITTECLFREADIIVQWFSVKENSEDVLTPGASFKTSTNCNDTCNGEPSVRLNIGFTHTEDGTQSVKFRLKVYHKENSNNILVLETHSEYNIEEETPDCSLGCIVGCTIGGGLFIFGIIIGCVLVYFDNFSRLFQAKRANIICIVFFILIIIGIGIVVVWLIWEKIGLKNKCTKKGKPEKAEIKLLDKDKENYITTKVDGEDKEKQDIHKPNQHINITQNKVPDKSFRPQPLPPLGAAVKQNIEESGGIVSSSDVNIQDDDTSMKDRSKNLPQIRGTGGDDAPLIDLKQEEEKKKKKQKKKKRYNIKDRQEANQSD